MRRLRRNEIDDFYTKLYRPYIRELKQFDGGDGMSLDEMKDYLSESMAVWLVEVNGKAEGFFLVEEVDEDDGFLFISETYIRPEYRRRHLAIDGANELASMYERIFLAVLPENTNAVRLWNKFVNGRTPLEPNPHQKRFALGKELYYTGRQ